MKNKILVIACLVLVLCVSLVLPMATSYADYTNDVLNNPQAIVNFNQLANSLNTSYWSFSTYTSNSSISGEIATFTPTAVSGRVYTYIDITPDHKYYFGGDIKLSNASSNVVIGLYYTTQSPQFTGTTDWQTLHVISTPTGISGITQAEFRVIQNNSTYSEIQARNLIVIDLTQMFGSGNEPNLQQCRDLFVADYYPYNSGTAMSFAALDSYNAGVQSVLGSDPIVYNNVYVFNNAQEYTYNYMDSKVLKYADPNLTGDSVYMYPELYFMNSCYIPFSVSVNPNISVNISWSSAGNANYNDNYLMIFALDENNNLMLIDNIDEWVPVNYSKDFVFDRKIGGLVFVCTIDNNNKYCGIIDLTITIYDRDITSLITSSYNRGYNAALDYYKNLYARGSSLWDAIYYEGYYDYPNDDHFTFKSLITSAVDVPVQAFTNLFDFDILGVNMKTFYLSVFTLCVIFVVLRLVL